MFRLFDFVPVSSLQYRLQLNYSTLPVRYCTDEFQTPHLTQVIVEFSDQIPCCESQFHQVFRLNYILNVLHALIWLVVNSSVIAAVSKSYPFPV